MGSVFGVSPAAPDVDAVWDAEAAAGWAGAAAGFGAAAAGAAAAAWVGAVPVTAMFWTSSTRGASVILVALIFMFFRRSNTVISLPF